MQGKNNLKDPSGAIEDAVGVMCTFLHTEEQHQKIQTDDCHHLLKNQAPSAIAVCPTVSLLSLVDHPLLYLHVSLNLCNDKTT
jgi:hypothetical protein